MSKSRTKQTIIVHHAPQVVAMATAAIGRLEKLLTICDFQIDALQVKNSASKETLPRELLGLARMVLTIQKELNKYAAITYPATTEFLPLYAVEGSPGNKASNPDSNIEIERDSIDKNLTINLKEAHNHTHSPYATQPKYSSNSPTSLEALSYGTVPDQEESIISHGNKPSKKQKFSHAFSKIEVKKQLSSSLTLITKSLAHFYTIEC